MSSAVNIADRIQTVSRRIGDVLGGVPPVDVPARTYVGDSALKGTRATLEALAGCIDHTLLRPDATRRDVAKLCEEARTHGFATVCVNGAHVVQCAELLRGSAVGVCAVVGFPLGAMTSAAKAFEAREAVHAGAREIDVVMQIGALKEGDYAHVRDDVAQVVAAAAPAAVKVIIETALLDADQKIAACLLARRAGARFVKTSTGFGPGGATVADVSLMRQVVGDALGVKASGGIRTRETAQRMLEAGASRIGASASVAIVSAG